MKACGTVHKYGDNVDTDVIIPCTLSEFIRSGRVSQKLYGGYRSGLR